MIFSRDPLANPEPLIERVYAYVAYRIGGGPDAEDVTSEVFERALRYRSSYDPRKGDAGAWLIGIAQNCVRAHRYSDVVELDLEDEPAPIDVETEVVERIAFEDGLELLPARDRELIAMHHGAGLGAAQIGELLGLRPNAVEVALHRARARLRRILAGETSAASAA